MNIESPFESGIATGRQSQLMTDDFVESLTEITSFFMPQGVIAAPVEYVDDFRKTLILDTSVVLAEIVSQQIIECEDRLSIRLNGVIIEGFANPREFSFFLSHTNLRAKIFPGRDYSQIVELSEFLRLEYPDISLFLTDTIFSLHFLDFSSDDEPASLFNGGGCLILGKELT